ncbi:MAG: ABC transporter permease [Proteobacteria bacterium]|nr:ABC transporter permease [Pseudomonadota bacterium]
MEDQALLIKRETDKTPLKRFASLRLAKSVFNNRGLVFELSRRELSDQHAGQLGGAIWLIAHPLLLFFVYAFLFTIVFRVRIGNAGPADYVVYLLSGLSPWLITQDSLMRATSVMLTNSTVVKKVMFPIEVLVAKSLLASVATQSILFILACAFTFYTRGSIPATVFLLPIILFMHAMLLWGAALLLGSLTPYFRDAPEFVRVFMTINIYLMPVIYTPQMVPAQLRPFLALNPFSYLMWCYQDILYFDRIEHPIAWVVTGFLAVGTFIVGSRVFLRLRHHLASVL